jgi:hypothetical protein
MEGTGGVMPFKKIDCVRRTLLKMPGNALKIWLYYYMREGKERLAWASEEELCETLDLNRDTMRKWRTWLVDNGWMKLMGHRDPKTGEFSTPIYRVKEGTVTENISDGRRRNIPLRSQPKVSVAVPAEVFGEEVDTYKQVDSERQVEPKVSQSVSEIPFASLTTSSDNSQEKSDRLFFSKQENRELDFEEYNVAQDLYLDLLPVGKMAEADVIRLAELAIKYGMTYIRAIWFWNKLHKDKGLQFRSISQFAAAIESESDNNIASQYDYHRRSDCPKCKKLRKCVHCHLVEDMTWSDHAPSHEGEKRYLHKGCEREYNDFKNGYGATA